ncbi:MAG: thiol reductant ABC exporter subunit CydD [Actinomycetota bacterium]|nr:thiol reductant ABC exporter subunit CydD [Actinomycetota bacterium]
MNRRLLADAGPARRYLAGTVLAGLAVTVLILAQAGLLARALAMAAPGIGAGALRWTLIALGLVVLARAAAAHAGEVTALRAAAIVKERLRTRLLRHAIGLGPGGDGGQQAGEITALTTSGLDALDPYFARYLPQVVLAGAVPVAVIAAVTSADWISGGIIAITVPLIPLFGALVGMHTKAQTERNWQLLARLSGHFLDVVQGLTTLKVFGRATAQQRVIETVTGEYRAGVMATLRIAFLSALVLELSAALATALVAVEVGLRLLYGQMSYPTALFVLLLTPEAYLPLRNAAAQFHASADGTAAAARAHELLDLPLPAGTTGTDRADRADRANQADRDGRLRPDRPVPDLRTTPIVLDAVTAGYPGRPAPVLDRACVTIFPGDQITLLGRNGAGKSTLLALLLRFAEPASGTIRVGQADLASLPLQAWRRQVGWLPQRPALFAWSVAENIALGAPDATRAEIERAAELAGAAGFIADLPDGYDTVLDERALRLSTGQRQKLALARLFLRDAPLLLLDEPVAHLDPASAAEFRGAIGTLRAGRTVIEVAHRPAGLPWPGGAGGGSGPDLVNPDGPSGGRVLLVADGAISELGEAAGPGYTAGPVAGEPALVRLGMASRPVGRGGPG